MKLTFETTAIVEADTPEEARSMAEGNQLVDDGLAGASCVDWEVYGDPQIDE